MSKELLSFAEKITQAEQLLPVSPAAIWIQIPQQSREFPVPEIQVTPNEQKIPSEQLPQAEQLLQENINLLLQENPDISPYNLYKAIADWLPGKIPAAIQQAASPETRLYLNMKSVFSAAEPCLTDDEEERNEMIQVAVTAACEAILRHKGDTPYPIVVYNAVKFSLSGYISSRDGIPNKWVRQDSYRRLRVRMDSEYFDGRHLLTNRELNGLSRQLAKLAGCDIPAARAFWLYWNSLRNMAVQDEALMPGESDTEQEAMESLLREDVEGALEVLPRRQRKALALYFGIAEWRGRTLKEVGEELGVTTEAVRQQVHRGIRQLRSFDQRTHILRSHY